MPSCTTSFERFRIFALSWSLAAPRSTQHRVAQSCRVRFSTNRLPGARPAKTRTHRLLALQPNVAIRGIPNPILGQVASVRAARAQRAHCRLVHRGTLEQVPSSEENAQEQIERAVLFVALHSGALSTSALTLPSRGRPQASFACLRPPLMSNVRRHELHRPIAPAACCHRRLPQHRRLRAHGVEVPRRIRSNL